MAMHVHSAAVWVSNQKKALEFWEGTLGFERRIDQQMGPDNTFVTVAPEGSFAELAINEAAKFGQSTDRIGGDSGISFVIDDVTSWYEEMKAKGVSFSGPPEKMPWGDVGAHFEDPDGNSFFINGKK
ncbi:putative glyoxalase superfamily protein PhnB [Antricoccus suffuscus]|uniref:Putative glyoxalase superfamily protein PhnB n=1 Tax=Antricoccus suffuscus TaxID=1629062 RepID=A0A2T1A1J0_9ACTN|nr:VOC family protein [Antricoccus suffuscus]PRZ42471.1 putative glyoxalase superfamily protein PhnB [Antricoccus suffuscus]